MLPKPDYLGCSAAGYIDLRRGHLAAYQEPARFRGRFYFNTMRTCFYLPPRIVVTDPTTSPVGNLSGTSKGGGLSGVGELCAYEGAYEVTNHVIQVTSTETPSRPSEAVLSANHDRKFPEP